MRYQVWHVHPEVLAVSLGLRGGVAGGGIAAKSAIRIQTFSIEVTKHSHTLQ